MNNERKFAIGDIHGCFNKLEMLIENISPTKNDTLIFLGDYIDRGPKSKEVVDYVIELSKNTNCIFLTGNHEQMMLDYISNPKDQNAKDLWLYNGGFETCRSYVDSKYNRLSGSDEYVELLKQAIKPHINFYNDLLFYHEDDKYIYVHAGVRKGIPMEQQSQEDMIWIRQEFIFLDTRLPKKVIFGHSIYEKPLIQYDKIGIDTGSFKRYGKLTAIKLPEETFIQV